MGPGEVGDEFDEIDEEEQTEPGTVYDTVTVPTETSVVVQTVENRELIIELDGDDVRLSVSASGEPNAVSGAAHELVIPRSAFAEALVTIGVVRHGDILDV